MYTAPTAASVPSAAHKHRIPLAVETHPVEVFYEASPALSTTAYLKATITNKSDRPLLRGDVNIFVGNEFSGQGKLATTGPGGEIQFPLGADEDIRLMRKVIPQTETEGVFSKDDLTTYRTEIEIGNYKRRPITILVTDVLPKTNHEDITIEVVSVSPKADEGPDADGIMKWRVPVPAGATERVVFSYRVSRPNGWQLHQ